MMNDEIITFRRQMNREASDLLEKIRAEENECKKYMLFGILLEIYEEFDIEVNQDSAVLHEAKINFVDYLHHVRSSA